MYDFAQSFMGLKVIVNDELMSDLVEDWSTVRSPSRAIRRRKRGFKQNITYMKVPKQEALFLKEQNMVVMHSVFYNELKRLYPNKVSQLKGMNKNV